MSYVIGRNGDYTRIVRGGYITNGNELTQIVIKVEYNVNMNDFPTIYNDRDEAQAILNEIRSKKNTILFKNASPFQGICEEWDKFDVSELKLWSIFLFDAEQDIKKQMEKMIR